MHIILGITGSVAAKLTPKLASALLGSGHEVKIVATTPALYFLADSEGQDLWVPLLDNSVPVPLFRDKYEWPAGGYHKNDPVRHIEARDWADLLLIAPLSANTLAMVAHGMCANFLCCIARAWVKSKPFIVAPAMNTEMWEDPITAEHLALLSQRYQGYQMIEPVEGVLACGETGKGAMARIETIVAAVNRLG